MVSEFRRKKLLHMFYVFFDTNKSDSIDQKDFELAMAKISNLRGYKPGDLIYNILNDLLNQIWEGLREEADTDGDGEVSIEEWVSLWDKFSENPDGASDWQKLYCKCIFQLEDSAFDGAIDAEEYSSIYAALGHNKDEAIEAFKKLAQGKEKITWDDFQVLWKEYFASENPEDPGNFIFGAL